VLDPVENSVVGESWWVSTACTPSAASAREVSMERMRAWACGLFSTARCSSPVVRKSRVNGSSPVAMRIPAGARTDCPAASPEAGVWVFEVPQIASRIDR
jgi:hypothetical protein